MDDEDPPIRGPNDEPDFPDTEKWVEIERGRGIFTPKDREFLGEYSEESHSNPRSKRYRIRERLTNSIYDFEFVRFMEDRDLKTVFGNFDTPGFAASRIFEFVYKIVYSTSDEEDTENTLEASIASAIERAEHARGNMAETSVSIDIEREEADVEEIRKKLKGGELTIKEFAFALENDPEESLGILNEIGDSINMSVRPDGVEISPEDESAEEDGDQ